MLVSIVAIAIIVGMFAIEAKFWGVVAMGASVMIIGFLPWLDRSPVKSIRYRGPIYKSFLAAFVVSFLILGYLGTQPPAPVRQLISQICTIIYFSFFLMMPWYSKIDKCQPEPDRVNYK